MKRSLLAIVFLFILSSFGRAQTAAPSDHSEMHAQHQEHTETMWNEMMEEHLADIKATAQTLANNLAQLKATLPMINDINERSRWQSSIAMWQAMADHFSEMAKHAEHMQATGMGCGMMMGHAIGDRMDHEHIKPTTPTKPQ